MTPIIAALGLIALVVLTGIFIYRSGEYDGRKGALLAPVDSALRMGAVRVMADSAEAHRLSVVAQSQHVKTTVRLQDYIERREHIRELPDSAMPRIVLTHMEKTDTLVMALVSETSTLRQLVAVDSSEKKDLRLQGERKDQKIEILEKESGPWCGMKCGITIGVTGTSLLVWLASILIH